MELKDFVEKNKDLFKWQEVENRAGITSSCLRHFISGKRNLSNDNFIKLRTFFHQYGFELEYSPERKKTRKIQVGDILPIDGWKQTLGRYRSKGNLRGIVDDGMVRVTQIL